MITVKDLIDALADLPEDLPIIIGDMGPDYWGMSFEDALVSIEEPDPIDGPAMTRVTWTHKP